MSGQTRDAAFSELVISTRPLLRGAALLMHGRDDRAESVVQAVLAQLYRDWPGAADARDVALRQVLGAGVGAGVGVGRPSRSPRHLDRFELVDASADRPLLASGIIADLAGLADRPRQVVILERWAGLTPPQISALLGLSTSEVGVFAGEAMAHLLAQDPDRRSDGQLTEELQGAVAPSIEVDATLDLTHGRALVRRRRLRQLVVAAAVLLVAVLGITQIGPRTPPEHYEARGPVPGPARSVGGCATTDAYCRASVLRDWRSRMAEVTTSYLDPDGGYFAGYTYSTDDDLYESPGYWKGDGGALGFDMFKLGSGSTDVYVQIATSPEYAVQCGSTTDHPCTAAQISDGRTVARTGTTNAYEGVEVQYQPDRGTVITVVARSTPGGLTLDVTRGQLQRLVQDDRLRLPAV